MPYPNQEQRDKVYNGGVMEPYMIETTGQLNFAISTLLINYIATKKLSYQTINDIIGALEGAKMEFYRRVAVPYEEQKIKENGDIY